jgi:hypothetical protein
MVQEHQLLKTAPESLSLGLTAAVDNAKPAGTVGLLVVRDSNLPDFLSMELTLNIVWLMPSALVSVYKTSK